MLIPIPPYSLELNPAEKMWQHFKSKIAIKIYKSVNDLELKLLNFYPKFPKNKPKALNRLSI